MKPCARWTAGVSPGRDFFQQIGCPTAGHRGWIMAILSQLIIVAVSSSSSGTRGTSTTVPGSSPPHGYSVTRPSDCQLIIASDACH
ncbi:hypothetical protein VTN96DRAFT_6196 [Rasamsonia emersonii]